MVRNQLLNLTKREVIEIVLALRSTAQRRTREYDRMYLLRLVSMIETQVQKQVEVIALRDYKRSQVNPKSEEPQQCLKGKPTAGKRPAQNRSSKARKPSE